MPKEKSTEKPAEKPTERPVEQTIVEEVVVKEQPKSTHTIASHIAFEMVSRGVGYEQAKSDVERFLAALASVQTTHAERFEWVKEKLVA